MSTFEFYLLKGTYRQYTKRSHPPVSLSLHFMGKKILGEASLINILVMCREASENLGLSPESWNKGVDNDVFIKRSIYRDFN